jgi:hypothetical protein
MIKAIIKFFKKLFGIKTDKKEPSIGVAQPIVKNPSKPLQKVEKVKKKTLKDGDFKKKKPNKKKVPKKDVKKDVKKVSTKKTPTKKAPTKKTKK